MTNAKAENYRVLSFERAPLRQRLMERCEWQPGPLETDCLIWIGRKEKHGYGKIRFNGKDCVVHRLIYVIEKGEIPDELEVAHRCDNPPCCSILHLWPATPKENMQDCVKKGRRPDQHGENHPQHKLTTFEVSHIKYFIAQGWMTTRLAERYGIAAAEISHIKYGNNWAHVAPFKPIPGEALPVPPPTRHYSTPLLRRPIRSEACF